MIVVDPIDAPCGATVRNIDLSAEITQEAVTELRQAWLQYHVLVFPDQLLSPADLERFTLHFDSSRFTNNPQVNPATLIRRFDARTTSPEIPFL